MTAEQAIEEIRKQNCQGYEDKQMCQWAGEGFGTCEECCCHKAIQALQAQAEKTCDIEKSNFDIRQYKLDTDTAYECGYNAGLKAQGEQLISKRAVLDAIKFEDKWLSDANGHNSNTKIAFNGIYTSIEILPTYVDADVVIEKSGFLKYIAENMNPNEYQKYYNQYYHTTDEKVGGQE